MTIGLDAFHETCFLIQSSRCEPLGRRRQELGYSFMIDGADSNCFIGRLLESVGFSIHAFIDLIDDRSWYGSTTPHTSFLTACSKLLPPLNMHVLSITNESPPRVHSARNVYSLSRAPAPNPKTVTEPGQPRSLEELSREINFTTERRLTIRLHDQRKKQETVIVNKKRQRARRCGLKDMLSFDRVLVYD